jgi:hypothetical protein
MATSRSRREKRAAMFGSGYGSGLPNARPAQGQRPSVNPFMIPKSTGLTHLSKMYPSNYYVEWDLSTWRLACDQVMRQGLTVSYAALTSWAYECSPFIQSIFNSMGDAIMAVPTFLVDEKGNKNEEWTKEICSTRWFQELKQEILFSYFWGFTGINFDPIKGKVYKYPMQQLDPINRMLRSATFNYTDGIDFDKTPNLLFVQPSTSYERYLGWMQPITRSFISMNLASMNWVQAGKRLAFPFLSVQYPAMDGEVTDGSYQTNPLRFDAEDYAANIDPSRALVTPYTIGADGKPQPSIMVESKDTSSKQNTHKIYEEFNEDNKNDIRELIFGGTLTSNAGKYGTKALGETHEKKLKKAIAAKNEFILAILNDKNDFLKKIRVFYKNMPNNLTFDTNRAKVYDIAEIEVLSKSVALNGNRLKPSFFINHGVLPEDIEEAKEDVVAPKKETEQPKDKKAMFEALKKKYQ